MLKREVRSTRRSFPFWVLLLLIPAFGAVSDRMICSGGPSKTDIARLTEQKLAHELYPEWLVAHPDEPCPTLDQLRELEGLRDTLDPWGSPYWRGCGPGSQIWVVSAGEDARFGTPDDIDSRD